jgi:hypothetical protein
MGRRLFYMRLNLLSHLLPEIFLLDDTSTHVLVEGKAQRRLHMLHANHFLQVCLALLVHLHLCFCLSSRDISCLPRYRLGNPLQQYTIPNQSHHGALAVRYSSLPQTRRNSTSEFTRSLPVTKIILPTRPALLLCRHPPGKDRPPPRVVNISPICVQ